MVVVGKGKGQLIVLIQAYRTDSHGWVSFPDEEWLA
jgi:hypothetical protein